MRFSVVIHYLLVMLVSIDSAVKSDLSREDLAGHLYNSLHKKPFPLADDVIVYPGHGAGSACGRI